MGLATQRSATGQSSGHARKSEVKKEQPARRDPEESVLGDEEDSDEDSDLGDEDEADEQDER